MGAGIAQSLEALYFTTELHTSSVRVRVQPGTKYLVVVVLVYFDKNYIEHKAHIKCTNVKN